MYSVPDPSRVGTNLGWVHYLYPNATSGLNNHSPLDVGDTSPTTYLPSGNQTWWGFPTWRETMAGLSSGGGTGWQDPTNFVTTNSQMQPLGLRPFPPTTAPTLTSTNFLPPIYLPGSARRRRPSSTGRARRAS